MTYRYGGIGLEDTHGTPVPATMHLDIAGAGLDSPSDPNMVYEGGLTRGIRTTRPGAYIAEGNLEYAIDINSLGLFLKLVHGDYTKVGPDEDEFYDYTFKTRTGFLMPSATVRIGKDLFEHVFPGCVANQLSLEIEREFAKATVDWLGGRDFPDALVDMENLLLSGSYPLAFHDITFSRGGADKSALVEKTGISINNNGDVEGGISMGSRFPRRGWCGGMELGIELTVAFLDRSEKDAFWGNTDGTGADVSGGTEEEVIVHFDAGLDGELDLIFPKCLPQAVSLTPKGRDRMEQSVKLLPKHDDVAGTDMVAQLRCKMDLDTL